jgi:hypothetical protein
MFSWLYIWVKFHVLSDINLFHLVNDGAYHSQFSWLLGIERQERSPKGRGDSNSALLCRDYAQKTVSLEPLAMLQNRCLYRFVPMISVSSPMQAYSTHIQISRQSSLAYMACSCNAITPLLCLYRLSLLWVAVDEVKATICRLPSAVWQSRSLAPALTQAT